MVFHDQATAANASFTNVGGTVSGGDGGNTQFYGFSSAAYGVFHNGGGRHEKANGGDVAFDANANSAHSYYHNYAAGVAGAYGGVTSFNNNPPDTASGGASAGKGAYFNYGAREGERGGGGHVEFSAKCGSPTAASASFTNYGSAIESKSNAGHTIFSINLPTDYFSTAGEAVFHNHPAITAEGAAGHTQFAVYGSGGHTGAVPTAGEGLFFNYGGDREKAAGGYTVFSGTSSAGNATLLAYGGLNGGDGGKIAFYDEASGGSAKVPLFGNGELDIGNHTQGVTIGRLELNGGLISIRLGAGSPSLIVTGELILNSSHTSFLFWTRAQGGFKLNIPYTILSNNGLGDFTPERFRGNSLEGIALTFSIVGNELQLVFLKA